MVLVMVVSWSFHIWAPYWSTPGLIIYLNQRGSEASDRGLPQQASNRFILKFDVAQRKVRPEPGGILGDRRGALHLVELLFHVFASI
jgi:hypothetical protein